MSILGYIFLCIAAIFLVFRLLIFLTFFSFKNKENDNAPAISWIICAKNEKTNLEKHLPKWLEQKYPEWELIIVLDRCSDQSSEYIHKNYSHQRKLRVIENQKNELPGKRNALIAGAKAAKHEHILLCDADCVPSSDLWMKKMASQFDEHTDFVIGLSPYQNEKGLLNALLRYETFHTAMLYTTAAILGVPYMAVGRNLGVKKSYLSEAYFKEIKSLSGDDDILINQYANKQNSKICIDDNAQVVSTPKKTWKSFIHQKLRHNGAAKYYSIKSKLALGIYYSTYILFYLCGVLMFIFFDLNDYLFYIFGGVILLNALLLFYVEYKLKFRLSLKTLLTADFCLSFFLISLRILSGKQVRRW